MGTFVAGRQGIPERAFRLTSKRLHIRTLAVFAAFVLWACDAYAEVMDNEPSLGENWIWSIAGGLIAIAAWRWRWWAGLAVTSIALLGLLAVYLELRDLFVGPAMRLEAGERYVTQFYLAVGVAVVLNAAGVYLGMRRSRPGVARHDHFSK